MKVLKTITMYRKNGQTININETDRDKYIKEGWSDIKSDAIKPEVINPTVKPTVKPVKI